MSFSNNFDMNEYYYSLVMDELNKKFWTDFDYHRYNMRGVFYKVENVLWIEVDDEIYNIILNKKKPALGLGYSRYSHRSLKKCYPSFQDCHECFKYWCSDCGKGTNSMYPYCNSKKCYTFFERIPGIYDIKSSKRRIQVFKSSSNFSDLFGEKRAIINKDMYNFEEVKDKKIESKNLYKRVIF